jgi:hypothetical protein
MHVDDLKYNYYIDFNIEPVMKEIVLAASLGKKFVTFTGVENRKCRLISNKLRELRYTVTVLTHVHTSSMTISGWHE